MTTYNYSGNNPVMFNDPMGNYMAASMGGIKSDAQDNMLGNPYLGVPGMSPSDDNSAYVGSIENDISQSIAAFYGGKDPSAVNEGRWLTTYLSGVASQNYGMEKVVLLRISHL